MARVLRHEPWRDEVGVWLHIQDATSITELLASLDYGGHPVLWPLLLIPVASLFKDPLAMQILHVCIATASVYLVLRFAPFSLPIRLLLCFGYYLGFEYAVISRHYALIVLFFFAFLSIRDRYPDKLIIPALLLFAMAETSVHGWILAFSAACAVMVGYLSGRFNFSKVQLFVGASIVVAGFTLAVIDMIPPQDHGFSPDWNFSFKADHAQQVLILIWRSYFLNTLPISHTITVLLSTTLFLLIVFTLRRHNVALTFFLIATLGLLTFSYIKYFGHIWHHGILFITLVGAYWAAKNGQAPKTILGRHEYYLLYPMLLVQLWHGVYVSYMDWRFPFSGGKATAALIKERHLDRYPMVGHRAHEMGAISVFLGKPIYLLKMGEESRRVIWDARFKQRLTLDQIKTMTRQRARQLGRTVLLIMSIKDPMPEFQFLQKVPPFAIRKDEIYYLYLVSPDSMDSS